MSEDGHDVSSRMPSAVEGRRNGHSQQLPPATAAPPTSAAGLAMNRRRSESYSTLEVAKRLGVTVQTVQRWVDAGHLSCWRTVGGHRRIDADSFERFQAATAQRGPVGAPVTVALEPTPRQPIGVRIALIVDDAAADREMLGYLMRRLRPDWQLEFADNGFAALLAIGRTPPDLLITDLAMPHLDGPAMLRTLAAAPEKRGMAILAVSSHSKSEIDAMGGLPAGVRFLSKPVDRAALERFLAEIEPQFNYANGDAS